MLLCGGCGSTPPAPAVVAPAPQAALPASLERARNAHGAERRANAYLLALDALHPDALAEPSENWDAVAEIVAELRAPPAATVLTSAERFRVDAVALQLALAAGDRDQIEELAATLAPVTAPQRRQADHLRARALAGADDSEAAALTLLAIIDRLDEDGANLSAHTTAAWRRLTRLPTPTLRRLARAASAASARTWLQTVLAFNAAFTSARQAAIWQRFRAEHPGHVAVRFPPPNILATAAPTDIALLLPLSGDLAQPAEAIRDGFLAAYLHTRRNADDTQTIRIYDTGAVGPAQAYRQAEADGADVVVGPLAKTAVAAVAMLPPRLPVVALNSLDDPPPSRQHAMLQLSLAPEDDAAAIAAALAAANVERVAVFANAEPWSARARARFDLQADATEAVAVGTLTGNSEATTVAGDVFGVTASQARHAALAELLAADLQFVPRRRADVDAVVAFVNGRQLMALKPALDFHFAADVPLYAPSQALRGVAWGRLEGLRVCAIPWLLHAEPLRRESSALATSRGALASLFALGVDGFRVANQLVRMTVRGESVAGSTGTLTVGEGGRIHRRLAWGRVSRGQLIALAAPAP